MAPNNMIIISTEQTSNGDTQPSVKYEKLVRMGAQDHQR
jgi:hypothetical protein